MQSKLALATAFVETFPDQAARVLEESLPTETSTFIDTVPDKQSAEILASMLPYHAGRCIAALPVASAGKYLSNVDLPFAANILRQVPAGQIELILEQLPRRRAAQVSRLLKYAPSMIGAWLEPNVQSFRAESTIGEAQSRLQKEIHADFHRIFVVDGKRSLKGFVELAHLYRENSDEPLINLVQPCPAELSASTALSHAMADKTWTNNDYAPVVSHDGKFLGVIRYAVIRSAALDQRAQSIETKTSGTLLDVAEVCYLGLADIMFASLSTPFESGQKDLQDG